MQTSDDMQLLREYATSQSEDAFATLVSRHINLVYSAALRQVGNPHYAEEIAQAVFVILARKCGALRPGVVLSGWLYHTARLASANFLRGEYRRQRREQEAYMQSSLNEPESSSWRQVAPLLDEAMARLSEKDRNAIVLRYFEGKEMGQIAAALGSSEYAAKMRLSRAVDKMRDFFVKRGMPISSAGLAAVISEFSVQAAPAGLAASITAGACGGSAVAASTLTLAKGTLTMMTWTKINAAIAVVAIAAVTYQWHETTGAQRETERAQQALARQTQLSAEQTSTIQQLQDRNASLEGKVANLQSAAAAQTPGRGMNSSLAAMAKSAKAQGLAGGMQNGGIAKFLSDPAMKKALLSQQRFMLTQQYATLVKQLNLTPEQSDKFYNILSDASSSAVDKAAAMFSGDKDAAAKAMKDTEGSQAVADTQLQALLGADGFAQYKEFKDTVSERMLLDQMKPSFAAEPLTPDQEQKLLQIMRTERENAAHLPGQAEVQPDPADPMGSMGAGVRIQQQANDQTLQQASAFLSPTQVQALSMAQSNMMGMVKMSMGMANAMFGGTNGSPAPQ